MKLRKVFTLAFHLLLVFGFCLPLIAEPTVDEARDAYHEAMHYYEEATGIRLGICLYSFLPTFFVFA